MQSQTFLLYKAAGAIGVEIETPEVDLVGAILGVDVEVSKIARGTIRRTGRSKNPHEFVTDPPRTAPLTLKGTIPEQRKRLKSHLKEQISDIKHEREMLLKDIGNDVHSATPGSPRGHLSDTQMDRHFIRLRRLYGREDSLRADRGRLVRLMGRKPTHEVKDQQAQLGRLTDYMLLQSMGRGRSRFPGTFSGDKGKAWLNTTLGMEVEPRLSDAYWKATYTPETRNKALLTSGAHAQSVISRVVRNFKRDKPPHTPMTASLMRLASS